MRPPDRLNDHGGQHAPPTRRPCPCGLRRLERTLQLVEHALGLGKVVQAVAEHGSGQVRPEYLFRRPLHAFVRDTCVDRLDQVTNLLHRTVTRRLNRLRPGYLDEPIPPGLEQAGVRLREVELELDGIANVLSRDDGESIFVHEHIRPVLQCLAPQNEDPKPVRVGLMPTHETPPVNEPGFPK